MRKIVSLNHGSDLTLNFPDEILARIFEHLNQLIVHSDETLSEKGANFDLYAKAMMLTCRRWKAVFTANVKRLDMLYYGDRPAFFDIEFIKLDQLYIVGPAPKMLPIVQTTQKTITTLRLTSSDITDEQLLALLTANPKIVSLTLFNCPNITLESLSSIESLRRLEDIKISSCKKVTPDHVSALLARCKNLKSIDFSHATFLTEAVLNGIATSSKNTLSVLTLTESKQVTDQNVHPIIETCTQLKIVGLSGTSVGDVTGILVSEKLPSLESIQLRDTAIGNTTLDHLKACKSLKTIEVSGCKAIDHVGVDHLKSFDSLTYAKFWRCSKSAVEAIKQLAGQHGFSIKESTRKVFLGPGRIKSRKEYTLLR